MPRFAIPALPLYYSLCGDYSHLIALGKSAARLMPDTALTRQLERIYARLHAHLGAQNWWPGESRWEIMVGAILTKIPPLPHNLYAVE